MDLADEKRLLQLSELDKFRLCNYENVKLNKKDQKVAR